MQRVVAESHFADAEVVVVRPGADVRPAPAELHVLRARVEEEIALDQSAARIPPGVVV